MHPGSEGGVRYRAGDGERGRPGFRLGGASAWALRRGGRGGSARSGTDQCRAAGRVHLRLRLHWTRPGSRRLLPLLADKKIAPLAAEAIATITGLAIAKQFAKPPKPWNPDNQDTEKDEPFGPAANLPKPDPVAIQEWWRREGTEIRPAGAVLSRPTLESRHPTKGTRDRTRQAPGRARARRRSPVVGSPLPRRGRPSRPAARGARSGPRSTLSTVALFRPQGGGTCLEVERKRWLIGRARRPSGELPGKARDFGVARDGTWRRVSMPRSGRRKLIRRRRRLPGHQCQSRAHGVLVSNGNLQMAGQLEDSNPFNEDLSARGNRHLLLGTCRVFLVLPPHVLRGSSGTPRQRPPGPARPRRLPMRAAHPRLH